MSKETRFRFCDGIETGGSGCYDPVERETTKCKRWRQFVLKRTAVR